MPEFRVKTIIDLNWRVATVILDDTELQLAVD